MRYYESKCVDPYWNLAMEEYLFYHGQGEYVLLWQNENSLIVGKHQNILEEINEEKVRELGVKVVRRNTGGGAVFHDKGNLNFSFLCDYREDMDISYQHFLHPIIESLKNMGIFCTLDGRNDLMLEGKKVSGSAQAIHQQRILHHGTLLFDSDLERLECVLKVRQEKLSSHAVASVRNRVTNIRQCLQDSTKTIEDLKKVLYDYFKFNADTFEELSISESEQKAIEQLANEKYSTYEWNYGRSPKFNHFIKKRFPGGELSVSMQIKKGRIEECKIEGDFLSLYDIHLVESKIKGCRYEAEAIRKVLNTICIEQFFGNITFEDVFTCFY